ncbi:MAG: S1 RNA-binding domain-containing protein [Oscillospiraceae bacterium]|nr:S1 RNA-binding domain-containing protein [Oscillospiraceae bacterium]
MELAVGEIYEGKVTGITKFGAFVLLPNGKSGLVHISELANAFVSDVHEHVQIGQAVKVKLLSVSGEGKINLSMKRALEVVQGTNPAPEQRPRPTRLRPQEAVAAAAVPSAQQSSGNQDFEDRLKKFLQESDSRMADNRMYAEHRQRRRR